MYLWKCKETRDFLLFPYSRQVSSLRFNVPFDISFCLLRLELSSCCRSPSLVQVVHVSLSDHFVTSIQQPDFIHCLHCESVLGPLLFIHIADLENDVQSRAYVDDNQLYIQCRQDDMTSSAVDRLDRCLIVSCDHTRVLGAISSSDKSPNKHESAG